MKFHRTLAGIAMCLAILSACKSSKTASANADANAKKKDPIAVEKAARIGNMLDRLATDLIATTKGNTDVVRTSEGINISFQPDFYFESSSENLTASAQTSLGDIAKVLNRYPYTEIFIEGHADSSGNQMKNKRLSEMRAKNVALFFKANGVTAERMAIAGYGATRPLVSNATPEGRKQNRRVVVKIRANEEKFLENEVATNR